LPAQSEGDDRPLKEEGRPLRTPFAGGVLDGGGRFGGNVSAAVVFATDPLGDLLVHVSLGFLVAAAGLRGRRTSSGADLVDAADIASGAVDPRVERSLSGFGGQAQVGIFNADDRRSSGGSSEDRGGKGGGQDRGIPHDESPLCRLRPGAARDCGGGSVTQGQIKRFGRAFADRSIAVYDLPTNDSAYRRTTGTTGRTSFGMWRESGHTDFHGNRPHFPARHRQLCDAQGGAGEPASDAGADAVDGPDGWAV